MPNQTNFPSSAEKRSAQKNTDTTVRDKPMDGEITRLQVAEFRDRTEITNFSTVMLTKMNKARNKHGDGWNEMSMDRLQELLREHVEKGDPIDVANFAMMIWVKLGRPAVIF